jgi:phage gp29-like protein
MADKPITQEVATVEKDIDLFYGYTTRLENPDTVLRLESAGQGVKLYEELERDSQVFSMLQTRSLALQACEWQVEPASDKRADQKVADFIEAVFKDANFDALTDCLMHAVLCGYKPVEIMWDVSEGDVWVAEFRGRRPSRFVFDKAGALRLLTPTSTFDGEPVPDRKFVVWSFGGHDWNPYGRGLGYHAYWPVWFKKNGVKFWVVFAEKFGSPTAVGKYPAGTSEPDKATLLTALNAIQQQTGIRIPDSMVIELLEAKRAGDNTYEPLCEYMDRAIAKIFLGQTLTTEPGDSGSYSLGKVHNDVRLDLLKADADRMCECINRSLVRWLVDYNFPPPAAGRRTYPRVWRRTDPEEDLKPLAERDKILAEVIPIPKRYFYDTYGIPEPEGEEDMVSPSAEASKLYEYHLRYGVATRNEIRAYLGLPPVPGGEEIPRNLEALGGGGIPADDRQDLALAEPARRAAAAVIGQIELDRLGDGAIDAAGDVLQKMLQPLLAAIEQAESLEDIGELLYAAYPRLDADRFQELLARAMFASALTGYGAAQKDV